MMEPVDSSSRIVKMECTDRSVDTLEKRDKRKEVTEIVIGGQKTSNMRQRKGGVFASWENEQGEEGRHWITLRVV